MTRIRSADGTDLAVDVVGQGPPLVLANGLGGSFRAWRPVLPPLETRYTVASWDYRGLYRSGPPATPDAVTIGDHVSDLTALLDHVGGGPAVVVAWSMGVQVAVEHALAHPGDVRALVLVCGAPGDPLAGVLHTTLSRHIVPPLTHVLEAAAVPLGVAMRGATNVPRAPEVLRGLRLLAPDADLDVFRDLAADFGRLDWRVYLRTIRAMGRHDAWPRLGELAVPTLVVGGTRDLFLPARTVEAMAARVPGAELLLVDGATHYLPVERPALLAERILRFVEERAPAA